MGNDGDSADSHFVDHGCHLHIGKTGLLHGLFWPSMHPEERLLIFIEILDTNHTLSMGLFWGLSMKCYHSNYNSAPWWSYQTHHFFVRVWTKSASCGRGFWAILFISSKPLNSKTWSSITIWLFNIAMENNGKSPFLIGKPSINGSFSMAMLNNQRVSLWNQFPLEEELWIGICCHYRGSQITLLAKLFTKHSPDHIYIYIYPYIISS